MTTYMLLFRDAPPAVYNAMSPAQLTECLDKWNAWHDGIAAEGRMHHAHPLEAARRVITGKRGEQVIDGPFAEAKELIAGYFMFTADSLDEATAIAQRCPNLEHGMSVEIREVAGGCHLAKSLGRKGMKE
ncbi:MAG: hypothetical protein JNG89_02355 [Planctomycetaceae bacterium]|nr:hypothetical protein [Planctomycetaceae bacterium]